MRQQNIIDEHEGPQELLDRVTHTLFAPEEEFRTPVDEMHKLQLQFAQYMADGYVIPGTPTLTNAGRRPESALSSCVVIPVDLRQRTQSEQTIRSYYAQNMGSGFDLSPYDDPVGMITWLNQLAVDETATGAHDRYIGNMASLHISHPLIVDFVNLKRQDGSFPHFNISVDISREFMQAVLENGSFQLTNGIQVDANELFNTIAECTWLTGDPGVLFLDRINDDNPIPAVGRYVTTPPCGEMGLAEGETCQFGYLNLNQFTSNDGKIDYPSLAQVTSLTTRALDNAIEQSLSHYPTAISTNITAIKRKIGIGVCGLAEMLMKSRLPYDSEGARSLARDVLSFVNFISTKSSVELAGERGSCIAMLDRMQNRYFTEPFLEQKYASRPTNTVSADDWTELADTIRTTGNLRNILTTALPPTGRASVILGVTSAIEPFFNIVDRNGNIQPHIAAFIRREIPDIADQALNDARAQRTFQGLDYVPQYVRELLRTAQEISPMGHILMVGALAGTQGVVDEAASKTVNLPTNATVEDVRNIFLTAYELGLKNIAVYRDNSKMGQPNKL
jgi:ribonucleoside-diphosphate reductase alpha chain